MRALVFLLGLSSMWAQYRLIGTQLDLPKKAELHLELTLMPTFLRLHSQGKWDTLQADLDFVFTAQKVYWLDHQAKVAYEVTPQKADSGLFFQLDRLGKVEEAGYLGERIRLRLPGRRIEGVWTHEPAFDWKPWLEPLGNSELALMGRVLGSGLPLRLEVYDEQGQLLSATRIQKVERLPRTETFTPPYPVRQLGK